MKKYQTLRKQVSLGSGSILSYRQKSAWAAAFVAAVSSCCGSTVSYAQGAVIEEVQVTARRRVEKDLDVPIAMTVMGDDYLRTQNIGQLTDLGTKVPGLQITSTSTSPNAPIVSIRGQRPNDLLISIDPSVPIYFNDVVLTPTEGSNLAMYDLQNVQVLKGPQGTLFGRNSTGGALLLTPTRPGSEFGGYFEGKVGNYELISLEGAVDLPVNDVLQFRLAGRMLDRDGYQKNVADNALNGKRYWDEDSHGARLSMNLEPTDALRNLLVFAYDKNDSIGRAAVLEAFNGSGFVATRIYNPIFNQNGEVDEAVARISGRSDKHDIESDLLPTDEIEVIFASNTTEIDLTDTTSFKSILGYRSVEYSQVLDADGSAFPWLGGITSATEPVTWNAPQILTETEQLSAELQLLGDAFDGNLQWITGAFWFKMQGSVGGSLSQVAGPLIGYNPTNPPSSGYNLFYVDPDSPLTPPLQWASAAASARIPQYGSYQSGNNGDALNEAVGLFGEATYSFNEQWSWTLGARYSRDDREVVVKGFNGIGMEFVNPTIPPAAIFKCALAPENAQSEADRLPNDACSRTVSERFEKPTWRTSLNFTPVDDMLVYGSISTGYRTGGFNMRGVSDASLAPYDEETVTSYEIGQKADWSAILDLPIRTNIAAYYQDYKDIQQTQTFVSPTTTSGAFDTRVVNAGKASISGVEFDVTVLATNNLTLSLAYAYTNAKFSEFDTQIIASEGLDTVTTIDNVDNSSADFPFVPEHTITATVTYFLPVDADLGDMSVMANAYWQEKVATTISAPLLEQIAEHQDWAAVDLEIAKGTEFADSYALLNLRYDWRSVMQSNFDFALFVDNATDEDYIVGGLNVIDILGINGSTYGAPRTFGASVRYTF